MICGWCHKEIAPGITQEVVADDKPRRVEGPAPWYKSTYCSSARELSAESLADVRRTADR
jgi:hypothetical protein